MLADDFLENIPNDGLLALDHFLRLLDRRGVLLLLEQVVYEWLEQLQRHLLRQAALMKLELGTHYDDRTSRVVDALSEKVLPEAALLTLERVRKRFERTIVRAPQHASAATVIEQRIDRLLKHSLLVANDDLGRLQLDELR